MIYQFLCPTPGLARSMGEALAILDPFTPYPRRAIPAAVRYLDGTELQHRRENLAAIGAPQTPLYDAVADGGLSLVTFYGGNTPWPGAKMKRRGRPRVALICDDAPAGETAAVGPDGWKVARQLRTWARSGAVFIHGAAGGSDHYRAAVVAAKRYGRVAFIETNAAKAQDWADFMRHPRTTLIRPGGDPATAPVAEARH